MTLGDRIVRDLRKRVTVLGFHEKWIKSTFQPDIEISCLSAPRGSAKTWAIGQLLAQAITPGSPTFEAGVEVLGVSASLEQSRVMLSFVREALGDREQDYRWLDSGQRLGVTHRASGTKLRILSSSGKRAMGLVNYSAIYGDEPASWETRGGQLMYDALRTSLGKRPGQRLVMIGTRAPAEPGSWWPALLDAGSGPGVHVSVQAAPDDAAWDSWSTIRKANPLVMHNASLRKTILRERDSARRNENEKMPFLAYRLNRMVDAYASMLVEADAWRRVEGRLVPPRKGRPLVAIDVGFSRSWTATWCLWRNGRSECFAVCPGLPDLAERERQDGVARGLYRRLHDDGSLVVDEGLRTARISTMLDHLVEQGISPETMYADRFLFETLQDLVHGRWPVVYRKTRWSESTSDISALRRLVADGPLSIAPESRSLARASLAEAAVKIEETNMRIEKRRYGRSRDDVAVCAALAAGGLVRALDRPARRRLRYALAG